MPSPTTNSKVEKYTIFNSWKRRKKIVVANCFSKVGQQHKKNGQKELSYKLLVLDEDFSREEFYEMVPNAKTFPQILVNGKTIGGYEELAVKINNLS